MVVEATAIRTSTGRILRERETMTADLAELTDNSHLENQEQGPSVLSCNFRHKDPGDESTTNDDVLSANKFVESGKGMSVI